MRTLVHAHRHAHVHKLVAANGVVEPRAVHLRDLQRGHGLGQAARRRGGRRQSVRALDMDSAAALIKKSFTDSFTPPSSSRFNSDRTCACVHARR